MHFKFSTTTFEEIHDISSAKNKKLNKKTSKTKLVYQVLHNQNPPVDTPPKFNSSPVKNGAWKTSLSYWLSGLFRGYTPRKLTWNLKIMLSFPKEKHLQFPPILGFQPFVFIGKKCTFQNLPLQKNFGFEGAFFLVVGCLSDPHTQPAFSRSGGESTQSAPLQGPFVEGKKIRPSHVFGCFFLGGVESFEQNCPEKNQTFL